MKKKIITIIAVIAIVFSVFTYVTGKSNQPGDPTVSDLETTHYESFSSFIESEKDEIKSEIENKENVSKPDKNTSQEVEFDYSKIPEYKNSPYVKVNNNKPYFTKPEMDIAYKPYEFYSELDSLGRCGYTFAVVCNETMPTEKRGEIGMIKPTGWHTVKYDCVNGKYLYNRCHLIGYQLTAENANVKNLITGTRYLNVDGMLPFENMVADYVKETRNHVMYRVTPIFGDNNLVAYGVLMEAYSLEDKGDGVCFNVFCYNVQPGVTIDYATGESHLS